MGALHTVHHHHHHHHHTFSILMGIQRAGLLCLGYNFFFWTECFSLILLLLLLVSRVSPWFSFFSPSSVSYSLLFELLSGGGVCVDAWMDGWRRGGEGFKGEEMGRAWMVELLLDHGRVGEVRGEVVGRSNYHQGLLAQTESSIITFVEASTALSTFFGVLLVDECGVSVTRVGFVMYFVVAMGTFAASEGCGP